MVYVCAHTRVHVFDFWYNGSGLINVKYTSTYFLYNPWMVYECRISNRQQGGLGYIKFLRVKVLFVIKPIWFLKMSFLDIAES